MPKILNFGSLNVDYVYGMEHFIKPGETQASLSREIFPGGKGLNQSVAAALAGAEVYHAGAVGLSDGEILLEVLKKAGVNLDYVEKHEVPTGHTIIQVDKNGQNCIILFGGANQSLTHEQIDKTLSHFEKGDLLVLQNEVNCLEYLMKKGAECGLKIAFNVSPFTKDLLKLPLELCSYLLVNEVEAAGITGMSETCTAKELLKALSNQLPSTNIVLTLGKRGSAFKGADSEPVYCGCYKVNAVDSTGSGDTYTGFLLNALIHGEEVKTAMKQASCAAAISVTRPGAASSIPTIEEVLASELYKNDPPAVE